MKNKVITLYRYFSKTVKWRNNFLTSAKLTKDISRVDKEKYEVPKGVVRRRFGYDGDEEHFMFYYYGEKFIPIEDKESGAVLLFGAIGGEMKTIYLRRVG